MTVADCSTCYFLYELASLFSQSLSAHSVYFSHAKRQRKKVATKKKYFCNIVSDLFLNYFVLFYQNSDLKQESVSFLRIYILYKS